MPLFFKTNTLLGGEYGTALQAACYRGHDEIVKLLLEYKADPNIIGE